MKCGVKREKQTLNREVVETILKGLNTNNFV